GSGFASKSGSVPVSAEGRGVQSGRRRVAAADPTDPDRPAAARQGAALTTTPRPPAVWCHVALNFPDSSFISYSWQKPLSNSSQDAAVGPAFGGYHRRATAWNMVATAVD